MTTELNVENVQRIFNSCNKGETLIEGIVFKSYLDIREHKQEIYEMLSQLPDEFHEDKGGGYSFLMACQNNKGEQWTGFHIYMEKLMMLGIAAGYVKYCLPREMWQALPGSVPYFTFLNKTPENVMKGK